MSGLRLPDFHEVRARRVLIALSGGADSTALTVMLCERREALGLTLAAAHVEHGIRGAESAADAEFCRALCVSLDIPFYLEKIDVPALARKTGEGIETAARRARYECLGRVREKTRSDYIALAHHQDDQAETVLMHLLRGCGPEGIGGMRKFSGALYRPLLDVPKSALEDYLRARGQDWRTDNTNSIADTPRNALRLEAMPSMKRAYPAAASAICRYAESARLEDALLGRMTDEFLSLHLETGPYGARILRPEEADEAVLRRAIRRLAGAETDYEHIALLADLCRQTRGSVTLPGGLQAERTPGALYFLKKSPRIPDPVPLPRAGTARLSGLGAMTVREWTNGPVRDDPYRQALRPDALQGAALRTRKAGDRMRPLGCGDRLLSDVLTDKKIDRPLRDFIPLVAVGNRVLWAVGVGISEDAKLTDFSRPAALLEWRPETGSAQTN